VSRVACIVTFSAAAAVTAPLVAQSLAAQAPPVASAVCHCSPTVCAEQFYRWYLSSLHRKVEPLVDDRAALVSWLTARRLVALDRALRENSLEADYFLQAQDWLPTWSDSITAHLRRRVGTTAVVDVVLGRHDERQRLRVHLVLHASRWRVDRVSALAAK